MTLKNLPKILVIFLLLSCKQDKPNFTYPLLKGEAFSDKYFGRKIEDPFRSLEDLNNKEVKKWYDDQREFFNNVIEKLPDRDSLEKEIKEYVYSSKIRTGFPRTTKGKVFVARRYLNENNLERILSIDSISGKEIEIYNTKLLNDSTKQTYHFDYIEPSYNGKYLVFGISSGGSEMAQLYIYDLDKKLLIDGKVDRAMNAYPNWLPDNSGFFYNQLKEIKNNNDEETAYEDSKVKFHKIETDTKSDQVIVTRNLNKSLILSKIEIPLLWTTATSDHLILVSYNGASNYPSRIFTIKKDEIKKSPEAIVWKEVITEKENTGAFTLFEDELFIVNYSSSSNGILEAINLNTPSQKQIIVNSDNTIKQSLFASNSGVYIKYLENGINGLLRFNPITRKTSTIKLPLTGTIYFTNNERIYDNTDLPYIGLEAWTHEFSMYKVNGDSLINTSIRPGGKYGNPDFISSKQVEVRSHDGEMVPLTIIYNKNIKMDGNNPTVLWAYGSFGDNTTPFFNLEKLAWFKRGGIFAIAHVRGGGEKGNKWYEDGTRNKKPNSWKDFISCAKYLIDNNYTSSEKLAAEGESAGAIPIGRAVTEEPELFKAAIISVGLLNAVRFENTVNTVSVTEFGSAKDSIGFINLLEMDVYHHIEKGENYPSILFTAGLNDPRVEAWQPGKTVARFQEVSKQSSNIILFRVSNTGHYGDEKIETEIADKYSFLLWQLGNPNFQPK